MMHVSKTLCFLFWQKLLLSVLLLGWSPRSSKLEAIMCSQSICALHISCWLAVATVSLHKPSLIQHSFEFCDCGLKVLQVEIHSCGMRFASAKLWSRPCFVQSVHLVNAAIQKAMCVHLCAHITQRTDCPPHPHPPAPHVHQEALQRKNGMSSFLEHMLEMSHSSWSLHVQLCCPCLSDTPTFFRVASRQSWNFMKSFLNSAIEVNLSCSSSRKVLNPGLSSTLTSNSKTSSSILPNFLIHWVNLALSNSSPHKSKQAKHQNTSNQSNWKQIKSIKLTSKQIKSN